MTAVGVDVRTFLLFCHLASVTFGLKDFILKYFNAVLSVLFKRKHSCFLFFFSYNPIFFWIISF